MHMPYAEDALRPGPNLLAMVELQDHLLSASNDLCRLEALLDDACRSLMARFSNAAERVQALQIADNASRDRVVQQISGAITALQFQDMASQLINHTCSRLRHCADLLANEAFRGDDSDACFVDEKPLRANPVTQSEMDAGSVELF